MCEWGTSTILNRPWFMEGTDQRRNGVPVDTCIASVVQGLWDRRLVSLSSCCGHGKEAPSLVIENGVDAGPFVSAIAELDTRAWELHQWQLVRVWPKEATDA